MQLIRKSIAIAVAATLFSLPALAQHDDHHDDRHDDHHDNHGGYVQHREWRKGYHMQSNDWNRGEHIDWHERHLSAPPRGYEWRQVDGNYVLAAAATGIIASVIAASAR